MNPFLLNAALLALGIVLISRLRATGADTEADTLVVPTGS
jgi:hypothetical protein